MRIPSPRINSAFQPFRSRPISPDPPPDHTEPGHIVILLAILAIGALWLQHHLGFEFNKLGWVTLASVMWGSMGKLADRLGAKSAIGQVADKLFKAPLRGVFHHLAQPAPLYLLGGFLAVLMGTVSSMSVRSDAPGDRSSVSLVSLDQGGAAGTGTLSADKPVVRFLPVFTSPFGRLYQVDAEGYVPTQLTVYPLTGRQVLLGRDLVPSPSVLFRPFGEGVAALLDGGVFTVTRLRGDSAEQLALDADSGSAAAFLLGRRKPISDAMAVLWALELTASGAPEAVRAAMLLTWRNPKQLAIRGELAPRDCLLAEIRLHDKLKARAQVTLSDAPFVDVLLQDVITDTAKVPSC